LSSAVLGLILTSPHLKVGDDKLPKAAIYSDRYIAMGMILLYMVCDIMPGVMSLEPSFFEAMTTEKGFNPNTLTLLEMKSNLVPPGDKKLSIKQALLDMDDEPKVLG
jgi:hypothetical protein